MAQLIVSLPTTQTLQTLVTEWSWEPSVLVGVVLSGLLYASLAGPIRRRYALGPPLSPRQAILFLTAQLTLGVTLLSPLDTISDHYLFSAHMVQHLLLAVVWPPLLLLALPVWMVEPLLRWPVSASVARFLTAPVIALTAFTVNMYAWHLPALYDLTLRNEGIHVVEHLSFMALGVLAWWPELSPLPGQRLASPLRGLYLGIEVLFMMALGIVFVGSSTVFYSPYAAAPRVWGISAAADQQMGGWVMLVPGNVPYVICLVLGRYHRLPRRRRAGRAVEAAEAFSPSLEAPPIS